MEPSTSRRVGQGLRRRGGAVARAVGLRRASEPPPAPPKPARPPRPAGIVEEFSRGKVVGWVSVRKGAPPTKITLHLGNVVAMSTWATPGAHVSTSWPGEPGRDHTVERVPRIVPGPADDGRNSRVEIRTFQLRVHGIWPYVKKTTPISVKANGHPLPIYGHGMYLLPPKRGSKGLARLREEMAAGHVFTQRGALQLSKKLDVQWQQDVMGLYQRVSKVVKDVFGHDLWLVYGTLLGAVRDGGYIGHDDDFDVAFLSRHSSGPEAARELQAVGLALIEHGFLVHCAVTALHVTHPDDPDLKIDVFHVFFDPEGRIAFPFGIAGTSSYTRDDWQGLKEIDFSGGRALVPVGADKLVEHIYGADWRRPKLGFHWDRDRTTAAVDGRLTVHLRNKVYWANFYAHNEYTDGSTFFAFVNELPDSPEHVFDIGCGDGRDARAFAAAGRTVLGLDQSPVGVEHATKQAVEAGLDDRVTFAVCDVGDRERFEELVGPRLGAGDAPVLFYLRFFLHSIPEDLQDRLLTAISELARPGDLFAAEFRTDKDQENAKVHGHHWRRFQNAEEFSRTLRERHGFTVEHEEEGTGLSPYRDEDPVLYRVVARR